MLIWQRSEAGSIREENQDRVVISEAEGVFVLADGTGPNGGELAEAGARDLARRLARVAAQCRPDDGPQRVGEALDACRAALDRQQLLNPQRSPAKVDFAAAVIVEGHLVIGRFGPCGLMSRCSDQLYALEPDRPAAPASPTLGSAAVPGAVGATETEPVVLVEKVRRPSVGGPFPLVPGDWLLACSQGVLASQALEGLTPLAAGLHQEGEEIAEAVFRKVSHLYDGDDRTMVLLRFLPADLKTRLSRDEVIETHVDKRISMPLWVPLGFLAGLAGLVLLVGRALLGSGSDDSDG